MSEWNKLLDGGWENDLIHLEDELRSKTGVFEDMDKQHFTLEAIEAALQQRLDYLALRNEEGFERPSFEAWLDCYNALVQVKQAQALERQNEVLEQIVRQLRVGIVVEQA